MMAQSVTAVKDGSIFAKNAYDFASSSRSESSESCNVWLPTIQALVRIVGLGHKGDG